MNQFITNKLTTYSALIIGIFTALFLLFAVIPTASADLQPGGCYANGVGSSIAVYRADGTTPVAGGTVQSGELLKYEATLAYQNSIPGACYFEGGTLSIVTPDGVSHVVASGAGIPLVTGIFVAPQQSYVVSEADLDDVSGKLEASLIYQNGISHQDEDEQTTSASNNIENTYEDVVLVVTKDATPSFDRTHRWTIDKAVDVNVHNLLNGESGDSVYTLTVDKSTTDDNYAVAGTITINNPALFASANITSVTDVLSIDGSADSLDCGVSFPYELAPGADLLCSYSSALADTTSQVNTATADTDGDVGGGQGTADVDFSQVTPNVIGDDQVTVTDTFSEFEDQNGPGPITTNDDAIYNYTVSFMCGEDEGEHPNTATLVEPDLSDNENVTVNCAEGLIVTKDATPSFDRTHRWTIDKAVDVNVHNLLNGESSDSVYTLTVDKTTVDDNYAVTGNISVHNPNDTESASVTNVTDNIAGVGAAIVDCSADENWEGSFPVNLPAGATLDCTYSSTLPDGATRLNTATAETSGQIPGDEGTADVDFTGVNPNVIGDDQVTVTDTFSEFEDQNGPGPITTNDDAIYNYTVSFMCGEDEGEHPNTATLVEPDLSDNENVTVNCAEGLVIEKTANTSYNTKYTWDIDKTGSKTSVELDDGESATVDYTVTVSPSEADVDMAVSGTVTVTNPAGNPEVEVTDVADVLDASGAASLDCTDEDGDTSAPWTLSGSEVLSCTYSEDVSDMDDTLNTVTVTTDGTVPGGEATADVVWGEPDDIIDECIDVSDSNVGGLLGTVCADDLPEDMEFTYSLEFGTEDSADVVLECGEGEHLNVADFVTNDTGATDDDDWTVTTDVTCNQFAGCTPGYWKNNWWSEDEEVDPNFSDLYNDTFNNPVQDWTLLEALGAKGGDWNALARHAVAALLNASLFGDTEYSYPMSPQEVIDSVNALADDASKGEINTLKNQFDEWNNLGCPMNAHGDPQIIEEVLEV